MVLQALEPNMPASEGHWRAALGSLSQGSGRCPAWALLPIAD